MSIQPKITFREADSSPAMHKAIDESFGKLSELLLHEKTPIEYHITIEQHGVHAHTRVAAYLKTPHHECFAEHTGPDVFAEIAEVGSRLLEQYNKEREKRQDRHQKGCDKLCQFERAHGPVED